MQNQMNKYRRLKNLFLRQSYLDAWEDYQRSILKKSFPKWDYIVLTASNEEQGKAFQSKYTSGTSGDNSERLLCADSGNFRRYAG